MNKANVFQDRLQNFKCSLEREVGHMPQKRKLSGI